MNVPGFVVLVPVKPSVDAKSRLGLDADRRLVLRHAFAQDALAAARTCAGVEVVVVGDATGLGVRALPDEGRGDLNAALRNAARAAARPGLGMAVLLADLPCLRSEDLSAALLQAREAVAGRVPRYVADADGRGTTLLAAPPGTALDPHFGRDSADRHRGAGAVPVDLDVPSLRRDVDTLADLEAAALLGVGPHTRAALDLLGFPDNASGDAERR